MRYYNAEGTHTHEPTLRTRISRYNRGACCWWVPPSHTRPMKANRSSHPQTLDFLIFQNRNHTLRPTQKVVRTRLTMVTMRKARARPVGAKAGWASMSPWSSSAVTMSQSSHKCHAHTHRSFACGYALRSNGRSCDQEPACQPPLAIGSWL